jgi:hypothetical protein
MLTAAVCVAKLKVGEAEEQKSNGQMRRRCNATASGIFPLPPSAHFGWQLATASSTATMLRTTRQESFLLQQRERWPLEGSRLLAASCDGERRPLRTEGTLRCSLSANQHWKQRQGSNACLSVRGRYAVRFHRISRPLSLIGVPRFCI